MSVWVPSLLPQYVVNHHSLWSENWVPRGISLPPRVGFALEAQCTVLCSSLFEVLPFLRQDLKGWSPVVHVEKPTAPRWAWFEPLREGFILTQFFCSPLRTWQWSTKWVSGQPGLRSEAASQKVKTEQEPERQAWGSELSSQNPSMVLSAAIPMPERHDAPWLASQSSFLSVFHANEKHRSTKPGERCLRSHTWGWPLATYGCAHRQPGRMACMYVPIHVCKKLPDQQRTPLLFLWARTSPQAGSVLLCLRSWPLLMAWQVGILSIRAWMSIL